MTVFGYFRYSKPYFVISLQAICTIAWNKGDLPTCTVLLSPASVNPNGVIVDTDNSGCPLSLCFHVVLRSASAVYFLVVLVISLVQTAQEFDARWLIYASYWNLLLLIVDCCLKAFTSFIHCKLSLDSNARRRLESSQTTCHTDNSSFKSGLTMPHNGLC